MTKCNLPVYAAFTARKISLHENKMHNKVYYETKIYEEERWWIRPGLRLLAQT